MVTILLALGQVKEDLVALLDRTAVKGACRELGYRWRDRRLDPYTTLHPFLLQVLSPHFSPGISTAHNVSRNRGLSWGTLNTVSRYAAHKGRRSIVFGTRNALGLPSVLGRWSLGARGGSARRVEYLCAAQTAGALLVRTPVRTEAGVFLCEREAPPRRLSR